MAGNKNSGRRAGGPDFSGRVRSLFDRSLEKLELKGDADKLMQAALKDDFIGTIQRMASYAPKQVDMTLEQTVLLDTTQLTTDVLNTMFAAKEADEHNEGTDTAVH
jgi:hypothetical protein